MTRQLRRNLLSLAGLGFFLFLALGSLPSTNRNQSNAESNRNSGSTTHNADTKTYSNAASNFSGKLAENHVDFTFDYPSSWTMDPEAGKGDSPNFVKVEQTTPDKVTLENFAVGYFSGQRELMPQLAEQLNQQFSGGFPEYKKVSQGETRIGPYDGYEFRFTAHSDKTSRGALDIWGRVVLLPGNTNRKGAALIMLATSASPDVKSVKDVGEKGELPVILNSFRFED